MIVIVGLIVAFLLIAVFSNRKTRLCRWREARHNGRVTYSCVHCGASVSGVIGKPPKACLRASNG